MLPSKTIPDVKNRKRPMKGIAAGAVPQRKKARITSGTEVEVTENKGNPRAGHSSSNTASRSATVSPASSFQMSYPVPVKVCNVS